MSESDQTFELRCHFCGALNQFKKNELYEQRDGGKEVFREKFCLDCNEPLTVICPQCSRGFPLDANFKKNFYFKPLPSFWDPTPSPLDSLQPLTEKALNIYEQRAISLTPTLFKQAQKDFLGQIPELKKELAILNELLNKINEVGSSQPLKSEFQKMIKEANSINEEISAIIASIDPQTQVVNEKMEKNLKKGIEFMAIVKLTKDYLSNIKKIREIEIKNEQDSLRPGFEKIKDYLQQDPKFYRITCPACNTQIYSIQGQIYIKSISDKQLRYIRDLINLDTSVESQATTKTLHFSLTIYIEMGQKYEFHGKMVVLLNEGNPEVIGRDLIRELEYNEIESQELLFNENDPLARVSNSQMSLIKKGNQIVLIGQKFDEFRPGTYLNSLENDIRKTAPEGVSIKKGDKIIVPLTKETNNSNRIELILE